MLKSDWPVAAEPVADWLRELRELRELRWSAALQRPGAAPEPAVAITAAVQGEELQAGKRSKEKNGISCGRDLVDQQSISSI